VHPADRPAVHVVTKEVLRRPAPVRRPGAAGPDAPNTLRRVGELALPRTSTEGGPAQGGGRSASS
jgi:hypothetical protein